MCCVVAALFALGPRAALFLWWLLDAARFSLTFDTILWPVLGFLFAPWTTLMYVLVYPGGLSGFDVFFLVLAIGMDLFAWFGGGYTNRDRMRSAGA